MNTKNWRTMIPPTLFSLLGRTEMYPVYMDVLTGLYDLNFSIGQLTYGLAKDRVDLILIQDDVQEIPSDKDFDDILTDDVRISKPGQILRRLEKSGWITRETDRLTGEDVIRFPQYSVKLIRSFQDVVDGKDVEYDAQILSILNMLTQNSIQKRKSIRQANKMMIELLDEVQGLVQQFASLRTDIDAVDYKSLAEWTEAYNNSGMKREYDNLRLRNSPDRWYTEIMTTITDLQQETNSIADESVQSETNHSFEKPNPSKVRSVADEIAGQLSFLEYGLNQLIELIEELDKRSGEFTQTYNRRVSTAVGNVTSEKFLEKLDTLFESLRDLPRWRGGGDPILNDGVGVTSRFHYTSPNAIRPLAGNIGKTAVDLGVFEENPVTEIGDSAINYMIMKSAEINPHDVKAYYDILFGEKTEMRANDIMGSSLSETLYFIRLLDCCGAPNTYGYEIVWDDAVEGIPEDVTENQYRRISNVTIRRLGKKEKK